MKKILAKCLIVAMVGLFCGCAGFGKFSPSVQSAVDYVCAGDEGKLTAADMLAALDFGKSLYSGDPVNIEQAFAVLSIVKRTGCFVVGQLEAAFRVVDAVNTAAQVKQLKMLKAAPSALPEYAPLRKLIK